MALLSRLELLPPELIQHILGLPPVATSLLSSILTCSPLYKAFIKVEVPVTSKVVRNVINKEVLPEAVATWKSSRLAPWTKESLQNFADDQLRSRQAPQSLWTLSEALPLADFHRYVEYFTLDFASQTLARLGDSSTSNTVLSNSPSSSELHRIQRAFYRFEIYCNLFRSRKPRPFDMDEQPSIFFSKFSPWENEQIGCVHDYLFYKVSPGKQAHGLVSLRSLTVTAFNEITEHDVAWGASGILDAYDLDSGYMQHVLSLGLTKLHDTIAAESYDERRRLLYKLYLAIDLDFLHEGLELANEPSDGVPLS